MAPRAWKKVWLLAARTVDFRLMIRVEKKENHDQYPAKPDALRFFVPRDYLSGSSLVDLAECRLSHVLSAWLLDTGALIAIKKVL